MTGLIVVVVLVCDLQSAVRETVRGQMTLGDHVANESHSLCVGTLSHARHILQSHHIGNFSSHHPPLSTSIVRVLLTMLLFCIVCIHSTPIVPNLVMINNHNCALTLSFMYIFP